VITNKNKKSSDKLNVDYTDIFTGLWLQEFAFEKEIV